MPVASSSPKNTCPRSGISSPAITRSSVVLPEPDGPRSARSSPARTSSDTPRSAAVSPNSFAIPATRMSMPVPRSMGRSPGERVPVSPLEERLGCQGDNGQESEERSDGEGRDEVVLIVENLNVERHGVGQASHVSGDDRHGAELAHGAGIAQQDAVEQRPADVRQGHGQKGPDRTGAQGQGRLLIRGALLLHEWDQLTGNKGKGDEDRRQHDAGQGE